MFFSGDYSSCQHRLVWPIEPSFIAVTSQKESCGFALRRKGDLKYDSDSSLQEVRSQNSFALFFFNCILSSSLVIPLYKPGFFKIVEVPLKPRFLYDVIFHIGLYV